MIFDGCQPSLNSDHDDDDHEEDIYGHGKMLDVHPLTLFGRERPWHLTVTNPLIFIIIIIMTIITMTIITIIIINIFIVIIIIKESAWQQEQVKMTIIISITIMTIFIIIFIYIIIFIITIILIIIIIITLIERAPGSKSRLG